MEAEDTRPAGAAQAQRNARALNCISDVLASVNAARLAGATAPEVVAATTDADRRRLSDAAATWEEAQETAEALATIVARLLEELVASGRAVSRNGGYVSEEEDVARRISDITVSRRRKTLAIAERTVMHLGRAVRVRDLVEYVQAYLPEAVEEYKPLEAILSRDLNNLVGTGNLLVVGRVRGPRPDGILLYLPATLAKRREEFQPQTPLTWLDYVVMHIGQIWADRQEAAQAANRLPRPITTQEIRARLREDLGEDGQPVATSAWKQDLAEPKMLQLALDTLAKGGTPALRPIPSRSALWVPASVELSGVEFESTFASDAERVVEAVRRAMDRLQLPAVSAEEVEAEIGLDDGLSLTSSATVARTLSDISKTTVVVGAGPRQARKVQRVHRVGMRGGANLYCAADVLRGDVELEHPQLLAARRYVVHEAVLREVTDLNWEDRFAALGRVQSPIIALGRARLLEADLKTVLPELERVANEGSEPARALLGQLNYAIADVGGWARFRGGREIGPPAGVLLAGPTLTPAELQSMFAPFNARVAGQDKPRALVQQYSRAIRRVRNRAYVSRRSGDARTAQQYLFDAVDARLYGVRLWGGPQARLAALMAEDELGELRDGRYVIQAVAVANLEQRLRAVAALAFLQPEGGPAVLLERARDDESAGVRELAIWALGFIGAPDAEALAREATTEDSSPYVRQTARRFLDAGPHWGWLS